MIVATDAGGTDFDDFQSLVHYLVYADCFDTEGFVSTPMGATGRKEFITKVIDVYERDYPNLRTYSDHYPTAESLRAMTKQGATETAPLAGFGQPTEASDWIIKCAKRDDSRPLWILVWGGLEDVAQALHDDPSITPKLRVYFIGGPNKKWCPRAYDYIAREHPDLWMIEANFTYYGWFAGGNQADDFGNDSFVTQHIAGRGALGDYFANGIVKDGKGRTSMKMGDTPSVMYVLGKTPEDPTKDSWGGRFVRAWDRPRVVFEKPPTEADEVEACAIVDLVYRVPTPSPAGTKAVMATGGQEFPGFTDAEGVWHFVFCPKAPMKVDYTIRSSDANLDGKKGIFVAKAPKAGQAVSEHYPHWWTDDPDPAVTEGAFLQGAKTVNRWREDYLRDFAARMERCAAPKGKGP